MEDATGKTVTNGGACSVIRKAESYARSPPAHQPHIYSNPAINYFSTLILPAMSSSAQIVRDPSHAGSWYSSSKSQLSSQLDGWLDAVQPPVTCIGPQSEGETVSEMPVKGARVIIAP